MSAARGPALGHFYHYSLEVNANLIVNPGIDHFTILPRVPISKYLYYCVLRVLRNKFR